MANQLFTYVVPGRYVMRAFACGGDEVKPCAIAVSGNTIEEVRTRIPKGLHMWCAA